jgi:hypothetical protein
MHRHRPPLLCIFLVLVQITTSISIPSDSCTMKLKAPFVDSSNRTSLTTNHGNVKRHLLPKIPSHLYCIPHERKPSPRQSPLPQIISPRLLHPPRVSRSPDADGLLCGRKSYCRSMATPLCVHIEPRAAAPPPCADVACSARLCVQKQ